VRIALAESAGSGKSIFEYDSNSNGAKVYLALTEEILHVTVTTMAKNNMDILLGNILGTAAISPDH
jgi:nitrogenase subunit NifH